MGNLFSSDPNTEEIMETLKELTKDFPPGWQVTDESLDTKCQDIALKLMEETGNSLEKLYEIENQVVDPEIAETLTMPAHMAIKMAISKVKANKCSKTAHISIIVPCYKEDLRLKYPHEEKVGENFLRRKVNSLNWVFDGTKTTWDIVICDDGCPNKTGAAAQAIIDEEGWNNVSVLHLQNAIDEGHPVAKSLKLETTKDSIKSGAVMYGFYEQCKKTNDQEVQIVCLTDADTSASLGLTGLLVYEVVENGKPIAVGSRYGPKEPKSGYKSQLDSLLAVKADPQAQLLPLTLREYIAHALLPPLRSITDTQCGFKAFLVEQIQPIITEMQDPKASFDMELLVRAACVGGGDNPSARIARVPLFWIDSVEASAFERAKPEDHEYHNLKTYQRIKNIRSRFQDKFVESEAEKQHVAEIEEFIDTLTIEGFRNLMHNWYEIHKEKPVDFGQEDTLSVAFFKELAAKAPEAAVVG